MTSSRQLLGRLGIWALLASGPLSADVAWAQAAEAPPSPPPAVPEPPPAPPPAAAPAPAAAPEADSWLHQPEGQARLSRVVEAQQQEAREQLAQHKEEPAAQAYAIAYCFTPLHGLLLKTGQAFRRAGKSAEALVLFDRLLAENPEPLLRAQATALAADVRARPATPTADADGLVRSYIDRGKESFRTGAYPDSIQAYATAYALQDLPRLLFNIAQAYRRLGRSEQAYLMYRRFLQADPATSLRRETEGYITELQLVTAVLEPQRERRPVWRVATGAAAMGVGLGLLGGGIAALRADGQCQAPDPSGGCQPILDDSGRPVLPRMALVYDTRGLGAGLIAAGGVLAAAGAVLVALPGRRLVPHARLRPGPGAAGVALQTQF